MGSSSTVRHSYIRRPRCISISEAAAMVTSTASVLTRSIAVRVAAAGCGVLDVGKPNVRLAPVCVLGHVIVAKDLAHAGADRRSDLLYGFGRMRRGLVWPPATRASHPNLVRHGARNERRTRPSTPPGRGAWFDR